MSSVRGKNVGSKIARRRLWFLLTGMLCLGGCGQTENGLQSGAMSNQTGNVAEEQENENYGYFAEVYSLKDYDTGVACVADSSFYYIKEEYTMNEEGQIQRVSLLYESMVSENNRLEGNGGQSEDIVQADAGLQGDIARELARIEASVRYIAADDAGKLYFLTEKWQNQEFSYGITLWDPSNTQADSDAQTNPNSQVNADAQNTYGQIAESVPLEGCPIQSPRGVEAVDGAVFLWDGSQVCAFHAEGQLLWTFAEQEIIDICPGSESLWVCLRTNQGNSTAIVELDARGGSIRHRWDDISPYDIEQIAWKADGELWFVNSRTGIASYEPDTDTYEQIFAWMDAGALDLYLNNVSVAEEQICVLARDRMLGEEQMYVISYGELPEEEEKQEIVFAMLWMDEATKRAIVEFNRTHSDYRIVAKTCTDQEYYEDYRKKIDMEITAGNGADIFILPDESYENYRSKGLLLDLAPYFAGDVGVSIDDFVEKAWERYRVGECLYAVPTGFSLSTVVGRLDVCGERPSWTIAEMMQAVKEQPQVTELLCGGSKEDVLLYCCKEMLSQESNIDFAGDTFLQILEFANQYGRNPESIESDNEMYHLMTEESLLMHANFSDVESVAQYKALLNSEISVVGYPAKEPVSCYLYASNTLAVRADSPYAEQAWEFVKLLLSEAYQEQQYSFPVLKHVLEKQMQEAMQGKTNEDSVLSGMIVGGEYLEIMKPTSQDGELVQTLIAESKPYPYETDVICDIVLEEAAGYFSGQKSAPEAAKIIQNRVQLYLDERK